MGLANLAMATGHIGRNGVGVNPLRGQNNVQGACDMGSFPHEVAGYRHVSDPDARAAFAAKWHVELDAEPGLRIPNMFAAALSGELRGLFIQGEDVAQSDPNTLHVADALRALDCLVVQDLFLNETSKFAHVFLPGESFLEKDGTYTNAERRINRVRPIRPPMAGLTEWETVCRLATAMGYPMRYDNAAQIMDEIAALTPTFAGVSFEKLDREGGMQRPVTAAAPHGTRILHEAAFVRGKGKFALTRYVPTEERTTRRFPLILTTGRTLTQYNVGTQTRRTANVVWHRTDLLEIHPTDAELRGIIDGDSVLLSSRKGSTTLPAHVTDRVPEGVVYTTFHHPDTAANVVTTENTDWATGCPEYKVTAVEVRPTNERADGDV
jgi:formate dehydrogenase major subunit